MHLAQTRRWRIGLLQRLEDRIWRDVGLLAVLGVVLPVLDRFSPPWLIFVVGVVLFMLHSQTLSFFHKRALLYFVEQSENTTDNYTFTLKRIQLTTSMTRLITYCRYVIY